jgi:hypothetical protein
MTTDSPAKVAWNNLKAALQSAYSQEMANGNRLSNHASTLNSMVDDGFDVLALMRAPRAHLRAMETAPHPRSRVQASEALKSLKEVAKKAVDAALLDASAHAEILDQHRHWLSKIMKDAWPAPRPENAPDGDEEEPASDDSSVASASAGPPPAPTSAPSPVAPLPPPTTPSAAADQEGPASDAGDGGAAPPPQNVAAPPTTTSVVRPTESQEQRPPSPTTGVAAAPRPGAPPPAATIHCGMSDACWSFTLGSGSITPPVAIMARAFAQAVNMRINGETGITTEELAAIITGEDVWPWWSSVLNGSGQHGGWRHERCATPNAAADDDAQFDEGTITMDALNTGDRRLAPTTLTTYKTHMNTVQQLVGNQSIAWVMRHPKDVMRELRDRSPSMRRGIASVVRNLLQRYPVMASRYPEANEAWANIIVNTRALEEEHLDLSELTQKQRRQLVVYEEVQDKFNGELRGDMLTVPRGEHLRRLLLAVLLSVTPKRADFGNLLIVQHDGPDDVFGSGEEGSTSAAPASEDNGGDDQYLDALLSRHEEAAPEKRIGPGGVLNYLLVSSDKTRMTLFIQEHKTDRTYPVLKEELKPELVQIINGSLERHPRQYLFVDDSKQPFNGQHFSKWVKRTFAKYFNGRQLGVSLWRKVHENQHMDHNIMTRGELRKRAMQAGHSADMAYNVYRNRDVRGAQDEYRRSRRVST